ncbi:nucleic-acid-binding protein from transposon X-element [Trichonephila clavipes]|nr:nucleic-acid-binding protein from transposon X-element [Trichonephila clavipes]
MGRVIGKGLRVYPKTPQAYHTIRNYIDKEKLEAYTYQLSEEKELKAVIRGMPFDMPPQQIVNALLELGITVDDCHVMTNRKTDLPIPLFLISLPKNDANRDVYNITELYYMKIIDEIPNKRLCPAQCFRCHGFLHCSKYCTRNPKCVKCASLTSRETARRRQIRTPHVATARATTPQTTRAVRRTPSISRRHHHLKSISGMKGPRKGKK